jgi:hypothetical protein
MDPDLLTKFMAEGKMPNFARLAEQGSFRRLTTSIPPQSPVAWSNLITGNECQGGHGYFFDFIHRDLKRFSFIFLLRGSRVRNSWQNREVGYSAGVGSAEQLRHGKAFWKFWMKVEYPICISNSANFPPISAKGKTLSGWVLLICEEPMARSPLYDDATAVAGAVEAGRSSAG